MGMSGSVSGCVFFVYIRVVCLLGSELRVWQCVLK